MDDCAIIHVQCHGDPSVGIPGCYSIINLCVVVDADEREDVRKHMAECFEKLWGEPVTVMYQDEVEAQTRKYLEEQDASK